MEWQKLMNTAIEYIEDHLRGVIDYQDLGRILNCSEWEFKRIFSSLAKIPISDYIRQRRLSEAIDDIKAGEKIIDIATKYGYDSQAAFSRAFKRFYGMTPSSVRKNDVILKPYPPLTFKLVVLEEYGMKEMDKRKISIIGGSSVGYALETSENAEDIHDINTEFWDQLGSDVIGTTALPHYGAFISEEKHGLMVGIDYQKVLEIGCGSGKSMKYMADRGADELWGLDISEEQIQKTNEYLDKFNYSVKLLCSPMEVECGIPKNYFDLVYSIYGIGWSTDLLQTFTLIHSYLKKGGNFIFSWSHPIHKCVAKEGDDLLFKKSYFDETWYSVPKGGGVLSLSDRKMSTYINTLAKAGFVIEEMIEESDEDLLSMTHTKFAEKAKLLPVTFVIKARKL